MDVNFDSSDGNITPSQIKSRINNASNTKHKKENRRPENVSLKPVGDFQKIKLRSTGRK